jgi:hypothetical protein
MAKKKASKATKTAESPTTNSKSTEYKKSDKSNRKKILMTLGILAVVVGAFIAGSCYGKKHQSSSVAGVIKLTTVSSGGPKSAAPVKPVSPPSQEQIKNQTANAAKSKASVQRTLPSNGHIVLSGTVQKSSSDEMQIKTISGQVYALAIDNNVNIYGKNAKAKPQDIKTGTQASATITVRSDGSFIVRSIRTN